jgi:hypothetical protein
MDNQENNIKDAQPIPTQYRGRGRPRKCDKDFVRKVYIKKEKKERPKMTECLICHCYINRRDMPRHIKTIRCSRIRDHLINIVSV